MHAVLAIQQVALVCPKSADIVQAGNFGPIRTFVEYATPEQKARFLPDLLAGKKLISLGMTEPDAGSAVTELKTSAVLDGDHYVINGSKVFSDAQPRGRAVPDLCALRPRCGRHRFGAGRARHARLRGGPAIELHERRAVVAAVLRELPHSQGKLLLGAGGFKKQISGFNVERLGNARALALGRHAFNLAREHAMVRKQFGRELCEFQGLQWKFAEMG
jgi:alkylation response protein AidB-like acyl-CoA dehydrogenase